MSKRIVVAMVFVVLVCMSIGVFAGEAVVLKPELIGYPTYVTSEWLGTTAGSAPTVQGGRYPSPANNATAYNECRSVISCVDQDFDGDMGVNAGRNDGIYPYSHSYGILAGTAPAAYSGIRGEGRSALRYDLSNTFSRMVWFDTDYFNPAAAPTTSGWTTWNVPGGPSKHMSMIQYRPPFIATVPATCYYNPSQPGAWPAHFDALNTTPALPINLNLTVEKVLWSVTNHKPPAGTAPNIIQNPVDKPESRWWEIYHTQPPIEHYTLTTFDTIFGNHSDGRSYVDRVVLRAPFTTAFHNQYGTVNDPYGANTIIPNNYPTATTITGVVRSFVLIDEPGTANDRFMYHGDGDSDPLINSLIADMRDGRYHIVMNFRAYRYYEDNWPISANYYNQLIHTDPGNYTMVIWFGDAASAEDWVLYN